MRVSVVVPAHESASTLGRTLSALTAQELAEPYEVIVVDDGSTDGGDAIAERAGPPVRLIRQPRGGAAEARNRGALEARGEVLAFTDADCFPAPGWLEAGLLAMRQADLVQGAVRPPPDVRLAPFDRTLNVIGESGLYESANLFVSRELFERVGGFRAPVAARADRPLGEDVAFGWRARRTGARTAYAPAAVVYHAVFPRRRREYVAERLRLGHFAAIATEVPELRRHFMFARIFLSRRTAAFDVALAGLGLAAVLRSPLPVLGALPYLAESAADAARWRTHAPEVMLVGILADAVGLASLAAGSVRARTLVL